MTTAGSVEIDKPIAEVFDYTVNNVAEWSVTVVEEKVIEQTTDGVGSRFHVLTRDPGGKPMELDGSGSVCVMLLNPTGGLLGGDCLTTEIDLAQGAHVVLTTPSATKVYRSSSGPSRHHTTINLAEINKSCSNSKKGPCYRAFIFNGIIG